MNTETPVINTEGYVYGFAWHNVGGVLRGATTEVSTAVADHYGQRAGHIPDTPVIGVLVTNAHSEAVNQQMKYQSRLIDREIQVHSLSEKAPQNKALVVPYINTPQAEQEISQKGMDTWGLPSGLVNTLKNKADCHILIKEAGIDHFSTPDFEICRVTELLDVGQKVLKDTETQYAKTGMSGSYPLGLMIRAAESDGGYGAVVIKKDHDRVIVLPDGKTSNPFTFNSWSEALNQSTQLLTSALDIQKEDRVVVSRLIDLADSPGESVVIINGQVTSLGWNGQVKEAGSSSCVGTSSYQPKDYYLKSIHESMSEQQSKAFTQFLKYSALKTGLNFSDINGVCNVDWMIPGTTEIEFQKRLGRNTGITVAEINPRFTNWTDAIMLMMWTLGLPQTVENMHRAINGQILTVDKFPTPVNPKTSINTVRDKISDLDTDLMSRCGSRVILRMPDTPNPGLIFYGDTQLASNLTNALITSL